MKVHKKTCPEGHEFYKRSEADILKLHGMEPGSIPKLREALDAKGVLFIKK